MRQERASGQIPDWNLERFLLGELDEVEMESIRSAVASDERVRARVDALQRSNEEILRAYPAGWMGRRIREEAGITPAGGSANSSLRDLRPFTRPFGPIALVAAVVLVVLVGLPLLPSDEPTETDHVRTKGSTEQLRLYRQTETGSEEIQSGDRAAEHDVVLLQVLTQEHRYGVIVSVDGRGNVTQHLPEQGSEAVELTPEHATFLEHAYELDDAPRWEVFVLATTTSPFSVHLVSGLIEDMLDRTGVGDSMQTHAPPFESLALPETFRVTTFTLVKESGHEN